jgi:hypothetical protein
VFILLAFIGLLALLFNFEGFGAVLFFSLLVCYAMLEVMTGGKKHYNSGVDNVLLAAVVVLFASAMLDITNIHTHEEIVLFALIFTSAFLLAWRFADGMMTATGTAALLLFVFFSFYQLTAIATQLILALLIMPAAAVYLLARKLSARPSNLIYRKALQLAAIVALIGLYTAGNFYVAFEVSMNVARRGHMPVLSSWMAMFYWTCTAVVPLAYVAMGIVKKDVILLRLGAIAAAVSVLTFRYYYAVLPPETAMIVFGGIIILAAYLLIKKLAIPYRGFVSKHEQRSADTLNVEGVLTAEVFGTTSTVSEQPTTFGGGSFGGAGAGSKY